MAIVIGHNCLAMLLYEADSVNLTSEQVQKLSVTYNNSVRRCFCLVRFILVRNVLYFMQNLPVKQTMYMIIMLLSKDCFNCNGVLRILSLISFDSNYFVDLCYIYDVHCSITNDRIKCIVEIVFANNYG